MTSQNSQRRSGFIQDMNNTTPVNTSGLLPLPTQLPQADSASGSFTPELMLQWFNEVNPVAMASLREAFGIVSFAVKGDNYELVVDAHFVDQARNNIDAAFPKWLLSLTNAINHPALNRKEKCVTVELVKALHRGESILHDVPASQLAPALHREHSGTGGEVAVDPEEPESLRREGLVLPIKDYGDECDPSLPNFALKAAKGMFPSGDEPCPYQRNLTNAFNIIIKVFDHMAFHTEMEFWPFVTRTSATAGAAPARWKASITTNIEAAEAAFKIVCSHVLYHIFVLDNREMVGTQGWVETVVLPSLMTNKTRVNGKYNLCDYISSKTIPSNMASQGVQVSNYPPHADGMLSPGYVNLVNSTEKVHNIWRNMYRNKTNAVCSAMSTCGQEETTKKMVSGRLNVESGQLHEDGKLNKFLYRSYQTSNCSVMKGEPLVRGSMNGSKKHLAHVEEKNNMAASKLWRGTFVQLVEHGDPVPLRHNIHDMIMDIIRTEKDPDIRADYNETAGELAEILFGVADRRAAAKANRNKTSSGNVAVATTAATVPSTTTGAGSDFASLLQQEDHRRAATDTTRGKRSRDDENTTKVPQSVFPAGEVEHQDAQAYSKSATLTVAPSPTFGKSKAAAAPAKKKLGLCIAKKKAPRNRNAGRDISSPQNKQ